MITKARQPRKEISCLLIALGSGAGPYYKRAMSASWRTVRVFISSTFRDMQAERDHLVRFVFPRLREELLTRRIHFVDVDLRDRKSVV